MFCEYCGLTIEEGTVHQCPAVRQASAPPPQPPHPTPPPTQPTGWPQQGGPQMPIPPGGYPPPGPSPTMGMVKDLSGKGLSTAKMFFKSPSETIRMACHPGSFQQGMFFYIVKALIMGVLAPLALNAIVKELFGSYGEGMEFSDFLNILIKVALFSLASDAVYLAVTTCAGKLMKSTTPPKSLVGVFGVSSIPCACAFGAACIVAMVGFKMGIVVLVVALCYCLAVNFQAVDLSLKLPRDKLVIAMFIIYAAMVAITYFVTKSYLEDKFPILSYF